MKFRLYLILVAAMMLGPFHAHAVYVENMPSTQFQPNGDTVHFFVTGDECYHRYHDAQNYTIVQAPSGWWVYALADADLGVKPSAYPVGTVDPATLGLQPGLTVSRQVWQKMRDVWTIPEQYRRAIPKTSGRNHGDYCNLVIFIRFADDTPYSRTLSNVDRMFSDSSADNSVSVYNYFKHASYNKIFIRTHYAPEPMGDSIRSYRSPYPRSYFLPYTEANPQGYRNYRDRTNREFELLIGAVNYINDSCPVPAEYVLDCDNDGYIDNVNFVVKGATAGWSELLWPHKWNLYGHDVFINGKQVNTFNFALEGSGSDYFGTSTFCHEMFHSLGAPDLYRYNQGTDISPVGPWDLMATNSKPPQHMGAYLKYKYGNWLDSIPLITTPGTYTLSSVADSAPGNIVYRFPSAHPDQFYLVEYRDNTETFETQLPGRGLLVYRIDTRFDGNANYDGEENFDEIWLFRPNSNSADENGSINEAYLSRRISRTRFTPSTNYYPYLSDGTPDMTFAITSVSTPGATISFRYSNRPDPAHFTVQRLTTSTASLSWLGNFDAYTVAYRPAGSDQPYTTLTTISPYVTLSNLQANTSYQFRFRGLYNHDGNTYLDSSEWVNATFRTERCNNVVYTNIEQDRSSQHTGVPFASNNSYNFAEQIFLASEFDGPMTLHSFTLNYAYTKTINKSNCTIYMGTTSLSQFDYDNKYIPVTELTPVYEGTITISNGLNQINLQTPFDYNGTDNLVLAIHDNSGVTTYVGDKFLCHSTDNYLSSVFSSTTGDAYPESDTTGTPLLHNFRNDIQFSGCPSYGDKIYACIISDNYDRGRTQGEGLYDRNETITARAIARSGYTFHSWHDGVTDNPRSIVLTQDTVLVAHFYIPVGIDDTDTESGYLVTTRGRSVTIYGVEGQPVAVFDLLGRTMAAAPSTHAASVSLTLPASGVYIVRIGDEQPVKIILP